MSPNVPAALIMFIRENLAQDLPYDVDEETPLLELGILDSLKTAMLLNYIQHGLGTAVPPRLIDTNNFRNVRTIAVLIDTIVAGRT